MEEVTWPKTRNIHLHHAALYYREKSVLYNVPLSLHYPHDAQQTIIFFFNHHHHHPSCSRHHHPHFTTTTLVSQPPPSPSPTAATRNSRPRPQPPQQARTAPCHNRTRRMGAFAGAMSLRAMWQPNDERQRCHRSSLLFGEYPLPHSIQSR